MVAAHTPCDVAGRGSGYCSSIGLCNPDGDGGGIDPGRMCKAPWAEEKPWR